MRWHYTAISTLTVGVTVRTVCEACGGEFTVFGNFEPEGTASGYSGAFLGTSMDQVKEEAKEKAATAFLEGLANPPLFWKPCAHCGHIQSWAQKFYLRNRVNAMIWSSFYSCLGAASLGSILLLFVTLISAWLDLTGIASDLLVVIPLALIVLGFTAPIPLMIVLCIIGRRRFRKRLKFWLDHPNYSGPREPSVQFGPPHEDAQHYGQWEALDPGDSPLVQGWKAWKELREG